MESLLTLPVAKPGRTRILQITDTHLFATREEMLLGINTWMSFQAVLDAILDEQKGCDLVVATGDLAQDHSEQAYWHFAQGIARLSSPCVWLPGNHDFQPAMSRVLQKASIHAAKCVHVGKHWQIILMDSQVFGVPHGELSACQLKWLTHQLAATRERYTLLLLHHHPQPVGCCWLDQHNLRNAAQLNDVLKPFPHVNTLLCGHIHQEMDAIWNGRRLLATPSTCVQFKPYSDNFTLDTLAPGWRWLELYDDGEVRTEVCRLNRGEFLPDPTAEGY